MILSREFVTLGASLLPRPCGFQEYAGDLYKQAKWIVVWTAVRYGLAVLLVSFAISVVASARKDISTGSANAGAVLAFVLTLPGILADADAGRRKAFMLKSASGKRR